jgi:hypothetical protein
MDKKDKDYPPKSRIFPQYAHLLGMAQNMPVIRKLLGLSEYGRIPTDTAIGQAVQRFVENDRASSVCESTTDINPPIEQRR